MKWQFKDDHTFDHRREESAKIRGRYPDRIPVIVEKADGSSIESIDKRKYLVPNDITVAQFMWIIRKRKFIFKTLLFNVSNIITTIKIIAIFF